MDEARTALEAANGVTELDPAAAWLYAPDDGTYQAILQAAPWREDPTYFQRVCIAMPALLKMVLHARAGGDLEVMGLMQGKVCTKTRTFYVLDAFALPVEGTETRVNAQNEAYEYMVTYLESCRAAGRTEPVLGWYHSHPGYGCWLSGIDVATQRTNQQQDPFVAVVIDPWRTMSAGRVDMGAFRTFPAGYDASAHAASRTARAVPPGKADDYGAHASEYYALQVSFFRSARDRPLYDALWQVYWAHALCTSSSRMQHALLQQQAESLVDALRDAASAAERGRARSAAQAARDAPRAADDDALAQHLIARSAHTPLARTSAEAQALARQLQQALRQQQLQAALFP
ncbi:COP9 signalosome catalytic subunit rri1 [Malassezia caprae]|uniref:COP9 signalosome complex subunit 5 n=1 Tax=Malassezia caprae TaxID=1381934 RepID=A0AAF0IUL3_9BASI|nr:COP9 signalosome catalytic subunit rri1 [Malassezia caprae]